jgi:hypothetical protein
VKVSETTAKWIAPSALIARTPITDDTLSAQSIDGGLKDQSEKNTAPAPEMPEQVQR